MSLEVGDYLTGFTSNLDPFVRRVVQIEETTANSLVLRVRHTPLEEIFMELDMESNFEATRPARNGNQQQRQLVFDPVDLVNDVGDAITGVADDVVSFIGDAVTDVINDIFRFIAENFEAQARAKLAWWTLKKNGTIQ